MKNILLILLFFTGLTTFAQQKNKGAVPQQFHLVSPQEFNQKMKTEKGILIDVRTPGEYKKGHLKGARLLDIFSDDFEKEIDKLDKSQTYFVYCGVGGRSEECTVMMKKKGFKKVYDMDGGIKRWTKEGLPIETN